MRRKARTSSLRSASVRSSRVVVGSGRDNCRASNSRMGSAIAVSRISGGLRRPVLGKSSSRRDRSCRPRPPYLEPLPFRGWRLKRLSVGEKLFPLRRSWSVCKSPEALYSGGQLIDCFERFLIDPRLFARPRSRRFDAGIVSVQGVGDPLEAYPRLLIEQR